MIPSLSHGLEDRDFEHLRQLVRQHTGISLDDSKRQLIVARIGRRLKRLQLSSYSEYCELVSHREAPELEAFVNAVTTNLTSFFREPAHFEHLAEVVVPAWLRNKADRRLRVWSAGCSSGEEAYCIAITLSETVPDDWDWRVLGTDLDSNMLAQACNGVYPADRASNIDAAHLARWFRKGAGSNAGQVRVRDQLRRTIAFKRLNLIGEWPMRGQFDAIFCRNVVIYFDKATQAKLFDRFADQMMTGGKLYIGHSETLFNVCGRFRLVAPTIYEKVS